MSGVGGVASLIKLQQEARHLLWFTGEMARTDSLSVWTLQADLRMVMTDPE